MNWIETIVVFYLYSNERKGISNEMWSIMVFLKKVPCVRFDTTETVPNNGLHTVIDWLAGAIYHVKRNLDVCIETGVLSSA